MTEVPARHVLSWMRELFDKYPQVSDAIASSIEQKPDRIDSAFRELLGGYATDPASVLNVSMVIEEGSHCGVVRVAEIPFVSVCAHHFLPFSGSVDIVYKPGPWILGLGKIVRLVECRSRRFQLQEMLVQELAKDMMEYGRCMGVHVVARARHVCVCYRGPNAVDVAVVTDFKLGEKVND